MAADTKADAKADAKADTNKDADTKADTKKPQGLLGRLKGAAAGFSKRVHKFNRKSSVAMRRKLFGKDRKICDENHYLKVCIFFWESLPNSLRRMATDLFRATSMEKLRGHTA